MNILWPKLSDPDRIWLTTQHLVYIPESRSVSRLLRCTLHYHLPDRKRSSAENLSSQRCELNRKMQHLLWNIRWQSCSEIVCEHVKDEIICRNIRIRWASASSAVIFHLVKTSMHSTPKLKTSDWNEYPSVSNTSGAIHFRGLPVIRSSEITPRLSVSLHFLLLSVLTFQNLPLLWPILLPSSWIIILICWVFYQFLAARSLWTKLSSYWLEDTYVVLLQVNHS